MHKPGFTLVELMVVIVIIGLLGALVVARMANNTQKAHNTQSQQQVSQLAKGIEIYRNDIANIGAQVINAHSSSTVAAPTLVTDTFSGTCPASPAFDATNALCALFNGTLNVAGFTYGTKLTSTETNSYTLTYITEGGRSTKAFATGKSLIGTNILPSGVFYITGTGSITGTAYPSSL